MYRRYSIFSTLYKTNLADKLHKKALHTSGNNCLVGWLNVQLFSPQHIRCLCGHTPLHRKTQHHSANTRHYANPSTEGNHHGHGKDYKGSRYRSKNSWLLLAGTGLFSYSVWKARHSILGLDNHFVVYADTTQPEDSTDNTETKQSRLASNAPDVKDEPEIPSHVPYLLIGAGTASHSAMRSIRLKDHKAKVLIVGDEDNNPYSRPPLSKELWYGEKTGVFYDPEAFYFEPEELEEREYGGVSVLKNRKVMKLDRLQKIAYLDNGAEIKYDKCLIATGGRPKNLPVFEDAEAALKKRVHTFRSIEDFLYLHRLSHISKSIAVIGGGFLGSELACALGYKGESKGMKVYHIFPGKGVMSKILPDFLSKYTTEKIKGEGVEVISEKTLKSVSLKDRQVVLTLNDGSEVNVDEVVVTVGIQPNDDMAKPSDLEVDPVNGGFMVNAELQAFPDIWVAGDVCSFYDYKYGRCRAEHQSVADNMGKIAGENMTGGKKLYNHRPYFWSDIGSEISYQGIGDVDSRLETYSVFMKLPKLYKKKEEKPADNENTNSDQSTEEEKTDEGFTGTMATGADDFYQGVVFYCREGIIVGILLWNVFGRGKVNAARQILEKNKEIKNEDLYELSKLLFRSYARKS